VVDATEAVPDYADVIREFYRAVAGKDAAAIATLVRERFAEDATLVLPPSLPYGGTFAGAGKLGRLFGRMAAAPEPVGADGIVVVDVIDGGTTLAARLEFDWYAPGSRTPIRTGALEAWAFDDDGFVREIRAYYWDTAACAAQVAAVTA
jgi:hypothetical protein